MGRRLSPDETAAWRRVQASVRALAKPPIDRPVQAEPVKSRPVPASDRPAGAARPLASAERTGEASRTRQMRDTLDGGWDRKISRGAVAIDRTVDLHGHTLRSAHALLDVALEQAIVRGDRVILLVTGKPPRPESERPHARGAIRAAIGDWLTASRHADRIASIRAAHPRHGGAGALYVVLRRSRSSTPAG